MPQSSGKQLIYAASILGGAILVGSVLVSNSLSRISSRLGEVEKALGDTRAAIGTMAQARPAAPQQRRRSGPDPNRRYTVSTTGAPARGPASAPIKIVEFSDFQ